jgi:hypothetical protein
MGVSEQIKPAFQDIAAPEIMTLRVEIRRPDTRLDSREGALELAIEVRERLAALEAKVR